MRSEIQCCYGCEERKLGCHGACERYRKARAALNEKKEEQRLEMETILYGMESHARIERYTRNSRK